MSSTGLLLQEPAGSRRVATPLAIGGAQAQLELPQPLEQPLRLEHAGAQWWLRVAAGTEVLVNGRPAATDRVLAAGDVIEAGGAQLVLTLGGAEPLLSVYPLRGNETIAPLEVSVMPGEEVASGTREIQVTGADTPEGGEPAAVIATARRRRPLLWFGALAAVLLALLIAALLSVVPVPLAITPAAAQVTAPDSLHLRVADRLLLFPGQRTIEVSHPGYRTERVRLDVARALASRPAQQVNLALLPGVLQVDTGGIAAQVLVDGELVGDAPGPVSAEAGRRSVLVRAPRHLDFLVDVDVAGAGREQPLQVALAPAWGWLELDTQPDGARIVIDGVDRGVAPQRIELDSGLRQLEVSAPGRRTWRSSVAIVAGETLQLGEIDLAAPPPPSAAPPAAAGATVVAAPEAAPAPPAPPASRIQSPLLGTLILVPAGRFMQGSERREQGRRSNETLREVTISTPFYLAEREVTNGQFRVYRATHAAGIAGDRTLDLDGHAASGISWDDAVAFCNWLSQREGLPAAYERREGRWQFVEPLNGGYRLPTEAEWEYAARYVDGRSWRRYSWGDQLPMPAGRENVAGEETLSATRTIERGAQVLPGYRDEHPVVAPVATYLRSALGFFDLGGNVSEWVHDVYMSLPPAGQVTDPLGDTKDGPHVIRGASWRSASVQELRLAWRDRSAGPQQTLGFRIARSVEVKK